MDNDQTTQHNEVMNGDEAAVFLKMPKSTLLKLCSEGQLPGVKVGRQWRFHRDALENWKREKAGEPTILPDENEGVGEPKPIDFSANLRTAEARLEQEIKPVVDEIVGSVGGDDFESVGEVRELDEVSDTGDISEVGEVTEIPEETIEKTAPKSSRRPAARSRVASGCRTRSR
jgi:excisionase family DNA binding protein